ncbi:Mitochondrial DNA replication protein YHM2 [Babesia microti strain RI]|uniref:Mitochondrial DNA replication protein YHM2 n=1 Tax=Babesia microti (strain RI) TaxID=1133968 RepID=A0A1N6LX34_BABMR|nr:Mitochondrial DNA replication protein YHM2 [Babesia microti strain RI]SIO73424.1 Mitochondrial DNA replication protein YHM2 [Babesia microti strain RI]|eukprot:XP_021337523.1 Mitochondrial DNA replication protein YHM2 [Babesia microti strain RI]
MEGISGIGLFMAQGATLHMLETSTLGMPLEVWKTYMVRNPNLNTIQSFRSIYNNGVTRFWDGLSAKLFDACTKGAVLVSTKECVNNFLLSRDYDSTFAGFISGTTGGMAQAIITGPCTFMVTARVSNRDQGYLKTFRTVLKVRGFTGLYIGYWAVVTRQATNWASRQGFTEYFRSKFRNANNGSPLEYKQEIASGIMGGALSAWNHPVDLIRIKMQGSVIDGKRLKAFKIITDVLKTHGIIGLYQGVLPRMGLAIWQCLFMVTGIKLLGNRQN